MRKLSALVFVVLLSGCAGTPLAGSAIKSQDMVTAEKLLTVSHYAYQGLGQTILTVTQQGLLKGQNAERVKQLYDKAGVILDAADTADNAVNEPNMLVAINEFTDLTAQIKTLVGSK